MACARSRTTVVELVREGVTLRLALAAVLAAAEEGQDNLRAAG
jgi:hypothetical protein